MAQKPQLKNSTVYINQAVLQHQVTLVLGSAALAFVQLQFEHTQQSYKQLYFNRSELVDIRAQLQTTFLGQAYVYVCSGYTELSASQKKALVQFLQGYDGPHTVVLVLDKECPMLKALQLPMLQIPTTCTYDTAKQVVRYLPVRSSMQIAQFLQNMYTYKKQYTLQELLLLYGYSQVVGRQQKIFFETWVHRLVPSDSSLFELSDLLLAKKKQPFMKLWQRMYSQYSEIFWVVFWLEQCYKAYFYIYFSESKQVSYAKGIGHRLPFAFLRDGWRRQNKYELARAQQNLYAIDSAVKTGSSLDLVYMWPVKYVSNYFL